MIALHELTASQNEFWRTNGYLIIENAFDGEELERLRRDADFILELIINSSLANRRQSGRLDIRRRENGSMIVRKIQPINDLSLHLSKACMDDRVVHPLRELMQDDPVLMEEKLNYKQPIGTFELFRVPVDDDRFPVHNDWAYYKYNNYPDTVISTALALDDCTEANGSIEVFPGSHVNHIDHDRVRNGLEVPQGSVDIESKIPLYLKAGSVCLFHSKLVHTSSPNKTDAPRRLMIFSHYPAAAEMGVDIRNGPNRLRESPWEWEYRRRRDAGNFEDQFHVNSQAN